MTKAIFKILATLAAGCAAVPLAAQSAPPRPASPFSPIVRAGALYFLSGQIATDPATATFDPALTIEAQTKQIWANIAATLRREGMTLDHVKQAQVYLIDMADYDRMNAAYVAAIGTARPARTTVQVVALPRGARIEIAVIAAKAD